MNKNINIGDVFDYLTVIAVVKPLISRNGKIAFCRCNCGNYIKRRVASLNKSKLSKHRINHCGCIQGASGFIKSNIPISFIYKSKREAKRRNIEYFVSHEYIAKLYDEQDKKCALTGIELFISNRANDSKSTASIDRIDSNLPYIEGNVQWVHKDINKMKWDISQEDFIKMCSIIANYNTQ